MFRCNQGNEHGCGFQTEHVVVLAHIPLRTSLYLLALLLAIFAVSLNQLCIQTTRLSTFRLACSQLLSSDALTNKRLHGCILLQNSQHPTTQFLSQDVRGLELERFVQQKNTCSIGAILSTPRTARDIKQKGPAHPKVSPSFLTVRLLNCRQVCFRGHVDSAA